MIQLIGKERKYYDRHIRLPEIGEEGQMKLKNAAVLVIGAGGLGCPALQYLAAAGIGHLGIMDGDVVDLSNLHRQILYSINDIGKSKARVAAEKLKLLNPFIQILPITDWITKENALEIISQYDVVLDCSDNFGTRYLINDACVITGKPLIYGAISKFEGQISVFNYEKGPTYRCLFPEAPSNNDAPNCAEIGVLGVLPGIIGSYQALECIKVITQLGVPLKGKLLVIDTLHNRQNVFSITTNPENYAISELGTYDWTCPDLYMEIDYQSYLELNERGNTFLLDVREIYEYEERNVGGTLIPLGELSVRLTEIPNDRPIVVMCRSGVRSLTACKLLKESAFQEVYNLKGGILAIV